MSDVIDNAEKLFFDALDAARRNNLGYHNRGTGTVEMDAIDIVRALLDAGWRLPVEHADRSR